MSVARIGTMSDQQPDLPDAVLLMAPGCAHCPVVLEALGRLLKEGRLGRLEVVNIAAHPEAAAAAGTRSVPWTRIGPFELEGLHSPTELAEWATHAGAGTGMASYLSHLLEQRQLDRAVGFVQHRPPALAQLLELAGSLETPMDVRIGIGALVEELQGSPALRDAVPTLARLAVALEPQVRADTAHYLGLSGSPPARAILTRLAADTDPQVREIAVESLALLDAPHREP